MDSPSCSLVEKIKGKIFSSNFDPYTYLWPSAYDTAWLAMIPDSHNPSKPMFKNCLDWLLNNQNEEGFWGEGHASAKPSLETLPATLACMVALKKWNTGALLIHRGSILITSMLLKLLHSGLNCFYILLLIKYFCWSFCMGVYYHFLHH